MTSPASAAPMADPNSIKVQAASGSPARPSTNSRIARRAAGLPDSSVNSLCGALAGAASGVVTCPLDVIKTKLQAQGGFRPRATDGAAVSTPYRGLVGTARTIWTQDGVRGLYRGLGPMLIGYLPTWAVYMGVYGEARDFYYTKTGEFELLKRKKANV